MRFTYDNSSNNVRNPHIPPQRVRWGLESTDEMGELYFQALPPTVAEYRTLAQHYSDYYLNVSLSFYRHRLSIDPNDAEARLLLGNLLLQEGEFDRAIAELQRACEIDSQSAAARYALAQAQCRERDPRPRRRLARDRNARRHSATTGLPAGQRQQ